MQEPLDVMSYVRLPKLNVAATLSMAKMLLQLVPRHTSVVVQDAAQAMHDRTTTLHTLWTRQALPQTKADLRPLDLRADTLWIAIRDRLAAYEALPDAAPDRVRALEIHDTLFSQGIAFLRAPYAQQHAETERKLSLIATQGFAADLDRLVGEVFIAQLRTTHRDYGDALGITKAVAPAPEATLVIEPLRALTEAMSAYALQLVAFANARPDRLTEIRRALAPIDRFRASTSRRGSEALPDDAPEVAEPVPPLDTEPQSEM